jgi:uncharacterized protein with PhoU and TrkA domain
MKEKKHRRRSLLGTLQRTPKWKSEEFSEIEYEPTPVKELLTEMKNISELIIDLAYSAVLFNSEEIAEEVKYLEVRMDKLNYDIRIMAMMAARSKEDAEQLAGILQIAQAAEKISNSAGDIILLTEDKTGPILPRILKKADEQLFIGIRRKECWIYNPPADIELFSEDMLIVRRTNDGYQDLRDFLLGKQEVLD